MLPSSFVGLLLPLGALAIPTNELDDRAVKPCTLKTTAALKYRTCPSTSCTAIGQYSKGASVHLKCVGTMKNSGWIKDTRGYWSSLSYLKGLSSCGAQYLCPEV